MKILFYDVSSDQKLAHLNGKELTFCELYEYNVSLRASYQPFCLSFEKFSAMAFHPYGIGAGGWKSWIDYFSTAIQLLCGHSPSREEIKVVKEYMRRLPNEFKRSHVDQRFVLSFVTYLFIGFKGHIHSGFISDSNSVDSLIKFTLSLYEIKRVLFSSFLCAHRDPKTNDKLNLLQSCIPPEKILRAAALVMAIAHNAHRNIEGKAIFLQQGISYMATSSIFPEVTVEYLTTARTYEMIERIQYQYQLVDKVLKALPGPRVKASLVSLDVLTRRIERFLKNRYGSQWRLIDFTSCGYENDPIVQIAMDMTLPGIKRMMPFFSGNFQQTVLARKTEILEMNRYAAYKTGDSNLVTLVTQAVEWFMQQHSMTISAKAVYETVFYYLWGKYCSIFNGTFAIGLDREHDQFQHFAWACGAMLEAKNGKIHQIMPLYARRNPNGREQGLLTDLSFRQFWRCQS